jgi:hypothetical protein
VSLRLAGQLGARDDARALALGDTVPAGSGGWEWRGMAGIRMSFFSPPVVGRGK